MNIGQMNTRISQAIKRGTSLDAIIPMWTSQAARVLEQNYTFSWMRRTAEHTFATGNVALSLELDPLIKSVEWIKPVLDVQGDGTRWYGKSLVGVEEESVEGITGGMPAGFWLDGEDGGYTLNLDAIPHQVYIIRMRSAKYTDWPTDDAATPTLLLRGELALFCQTLILFANQQRDDRMAATYGGVLRGAMEVLLKSEEEFKLQHQNDLKLQYNGLQ